MDELNANDIVSRATSGMLQALGIPDVWRIFGDAMEEFRFDKLLYGGTRFPSRGSFGHIDEALILHRGPQAYADIYLGEELYLHSPSYEWADKNDGFVSWPVAFAQYAAAPTPEQLRIVQLNLQFGVTAGYVGSLKNVVPNMNGVIGLSPVAGMDQAATDALWKVHGKDIETLCNLMHLRIAALPQTGQLRPLTTRQRETLEWASQGKTTQDIATILGLSVATVEKHLKMAREALEAQTTAHAVKKATALNLLTA
jgi:LuxR family transcriptional regulator